MIPQILVLKNFLSYQDAQIDFRGLHTACICGANGAGKSSLLEAMTWAVWGESRAKGNEEDVLHTGADHVRVDFQFVSNQNTYKIIRSRQRGKGSTVDFQVLSGAQFRPLGAKTIRATQEEINKTLKLDYDTFTNSAYLRQGHADEFMTRKPAERKQVLVDLLKLNQYEILAEKAKDISKEEKGKADYLDLRIQTLKQELDQRPEIERLQGELEQQLTLLNQQQEQDLWQRQQLQLSQNQRRAHQEQYQWRAGQLEKLVQETERLERESQSVSAALTAQEELVAQTEIIRRNYQQYLSLQREAAQASEDLRRYQELKQRQQTLEKELLAQENQLQRQLEQTQLHLQNLARQEEELQAILNQAEEIQAGLEKLAEAKQRLGKLDELQRQQIPLQHRGYELRTEIGRQGAQLEARLEQGKKLVAELTQAISAFPEQRRELQRLNGEIEDLKKQETYLKRVEEKGHERRHFQERLQEHRRLCEKQLGELAQKLTLLENTPSALCPLCEQSLEGHFHDQVVAKTRRQQEELQEQIWVLKEQSAVCDREIQVLRQEYRDVKVHLDGLEALQQRYNQLELKLEQGEDLYQRRQETQAELENLERRLQEQDYAPELQAELAALAAELQAIPYDEQTHALVRAEVEKLRRAEIKQVSLKEAQRKRQSLERERPSLERRCQSLAAEIQTLGQSSPQRQELSQLEENLGTLNYDPERHRQLSQQVQDYQPWALRQQELQQAETQIPPLRERREQLQGLIGARGQERETLTAELEQLRRQIDQYADHSAQIQTLEQTLNDRRRELDALLARKGGYDQQLIQLDTLKEELAETRQQFQTAKRQHTIYTELAKAFGKNGIQSLMIENILPQLEAETNHILARLTGNQLHIQFITQKESKTGSKRKGYKMIDTLDIVIADAQGTRPYETYSGGEAFRINFSIRLALARLLAQRAGTALQLLIIDEGFGTQDSDGCERLVAAINAIASDFACILTVTHMPQFKEAFQQRIEVYKSDQGSQVNLVT
ncbi:MAG: exonuclease subunit SbcC [Cyanobacteriota bacterium]|jgi:exonuclease SbcC